MNTKIYDASSNVIPMIGDITLSVIIPCSNSRKLIFREVKFGILRSLSVKVLLGLEVLSFFNFVLGKDNLELGEIPRVLNRPSLEGRIIHLDLDKVLTVENPSGDMTVIEAKLPSAEKAVLPEGVYEVKLLRPPSHRPAKSFDFVPEESYLSQGQIDTSVVSCKPT